MQNSLVIFPIIVVTGILCRKVYVKNAQLSSVRDPENKESLFESLQNNCSLVYKTCKSYITKSLFDMLVEKPTKNTTAVSFYHNTKWYKFPIISRRGPKRFISNIKDQDGRDVTEEIVAYMGPANDFYGLKIKVQDLGFKKLVFELDEETIEFDSIIDFDKSSICF